MADNLETLERDVAESRARLADTLDRLTSPETSQAVKRDLMETVHKAKDDVMNRARDTGRQTAQGFADNLKQRAIDNPFAVALIGAGIAWRLYKKPPVTTLLVGTGIAALMMGGSGRSTGGGLSRDPYRDPRQGYVPGGVAGYGYPVEEDAPTPGLAERAEVAASGIAERARDLGERAREAAYAAAAQASETAREAGERAREAASRAAAQVSDTAAEVAARVSATVSSATAQASEVASATAGRVRTAASSTVERTSSGIYDIRSDVAHTTRDLTNRTYELFDQAQRNPVVLGAVGFAAGVAIARTVRATDTGERAFDYAADVVGEGARLAASGVTNVVSRAADGTGSLAASTRAMASDLGTTARQALDTAASATTSAASAASEIASSTLDGIRDRAADAYGSVGAVASSAYRSATETASPAHQGTARASSGGGSRRAASRPRQGPPQVSRRTPGLSRQVQDQVYELGRQYPVLLGAVGLAVGAALGGLLEPTEAENRMLGEASDRLKQRAREMAGEQYEQIIEAAGQIAEHVLHRSGTPGDDAAGEAASDTGTMRAAATERPNERAAMEAQRQGLGPV